MYGCQLVTRGSLSRYHIIMDNLFYTIVSNVAGHILYLSMNLHTYTGLEREQSNHMNFSDNFKIVNRKQKQKLNLF